MLIQRGVVRVGEEAEVLPDAGSALANGIVTKRHIERRDELLRFST
jgi:hypothetical protein